MSKVIFTSHSPNTEKDDVLRAVSLLFSPSVWAEGECVEKVRDWFKDYANVKEVFLTDSGRTGLLLAVKALGIGKGDEVLVQAYTCVAVPNSVLWSGAKPVFVDIEAETLNMSLDDARKKITEKTKAIVVQHTFGNPADMESVMRFALENNLAVIEDCAHGLGADFRGKALGSFGDVAIFSFGRDKVVSAVFGGAVMSKHELVTTKLKEMHEELRPMSYLWTLRQILHPIIFWPAKYLYDFGPMGKILIEIAKRLGIFAKAVYAEERRGEKPAFIGQKLNNAIAVMAYKQLIKLSRFTEHRKEIAKMYERGLTGVPIQVQSLLEDASHGYLRYFVAVQNVDGLMSFAKERNILLGDWYRQVIAPKGVQYNKIGYEPGRCPAAEEMAVKSVNLPTHIGIGEKEVQRIIEMIKSFYDTNKNNR